MAASSQLITRLCNPQVYDHETGTITLVETHISWVLLTGDYAYKIKKPVNYGFVDFSTLEKRKFFCEQELKLNSRLAPKLYLEVIAVTGSLEHPVLNGSGDAIEYAVRMRQFPSDCLLSDLTERQQLQPRHIDDLVCTIAEFHLSINRAEGRSEFGSPASIHQWAMDNFDEIESAVRYSARLTELDSIRQWSEQEFVRVCDRLRQRKEHGSIRECHGDMHLGNMVLIDGKVVIFDGIEFNEYLRWIDVMNEIAFVCMDLQHRNCSTLAHRLLNAYLLRTGDYAGLAVFRYYFIYRAMVRAKVDLLRVLQNPGLGNIADDVRHVLMPYLLLAARYIQDNRPALILAYGLSGSGKSTYCQPLAEAMGAIQIRSDVERKRLHGYSAAENTHAKVGGGIYNQESSIQTYKRLLALSREILEAGFTVIVDACFLQRVQRRAFHQLSSDLQLPMIILEFQAPVDVLRARIQKRSANKDEPSEASLDVLDAQLKNCQPIEDGETGNRIIIATDQEMDIGAIVKSIKGVIHSGSTS